MSELDFTGHIGLVTGASRGIGAGIAEALVRGGARVIVTGRDAEALAGVAQTLRSQGG